MMHVPFAVGAIAIFHNIPSEVMSKMGTSEVHPEHDRYLHLDGCTLAKIFSAEITTWDDKAIMDLNPKLKVPKGQLIKVVHRVKGSSSTSGTTEYLDTVCPKSWS